MLVELVHGLNRAAYPDPLLVAHPERGQVSISKIPFAAQE
jgi:hypothetical protein